jgi:hypothetical protein
MSGMTSCARGRRTGAGDSPRKPGPNHSASVSMSPVALKPRSSERRPAALRPDQPASAGKEPPHRLRANRPTQTLTASRPVALPPPSSCVLLSSTKSEASWGILRGIRGHHLDSVPLPDFVDPGPLFSWPLILPSHTRSRRVGKLIALQSIIPAGGISWPVLSSEISTSVLWMP